MSGFHAGGARAYEKALRAEHERAAASIRARLSRTSHAGERAALTQRLRALQDTYRRQRKDLYRHLY